MAFVLSLLFLPTQWITWLLYREHEEVCEEGQFLFGIEFSGDYFFEQLIVFEETGKQVYDVTSTWWGFEVPYTNFCLFSNTSYFVVSYDNGVYCVPETMYSVNGQVIKIVERNCEGAAGFFPILANTTDAISANLTTLPMVQSSTGTSLQDDLTVYEAPGFLCNNPTTEAIVEIPNFYHVETNIFSMNVAVPWLYNMKGQPALISQSRNRLCVPRDEQYAILGLLDDASNYTVFVDGHPQVVVDGPFYTQSPSVPYCFLTLLTPKMLESDAAADDDDAALTDNAPVTAPVSYGTITSAPATWAPVGNVKSAKGGNRDMSMGKGEGKKVKKDKESDGKKGDKLTKEGKRGKRTRG
jgi:hypothetical protein